MEKNTTANMFEGRVADLIRSSAYSAKSTPFLTPAEQKRAFSVATAEGASERCFFWGGAPGCDRRAAIFLPEWMAPEVAFGGAFDPAREDALREIIDSYGESGEVSGIISHVEISGGAYTELSHRDYLGALISLGLERDAIGDIALTGPSSAIVFATPAASALILAELSSVGHEKVEVKSRALPGSFRVEHEFEVITDTVMSPRLDGVIRALCKVSRDDAADLVRRGDVTLNYEVASKPDVTLEKGDVISVRGYGKYIYDGDRGVNRRGRLRIDARKYV